VWRNCLHGNAGQKTPAKPSVSGRSQPLNAERSIKAPEHQGVFGEIRQPDKFLWALTGMGLMLVMAGFRIVPIAAASLMGALVMVYRAF